MARMKIEQSVLDNAIEASLIDTVLMLEEEILKITPRDPSRPPLDPTRRVTWNLKRSIGHQQKSKFEFVIGTKQGEAEYWKALEFGTPRMAPRSFLRKGIVDSRDKALKHFARVFKQAIQ